MENIIVTIPAQEFSLNEYMGHYGPCYLEAALIKAGYKDVIVFGVGRTRIGDDTYSPSSAFSIDTVRRDFSKELPITIELVPEEKRNIDEVDENEKLIDLIVENYNPPQV